MVKQKSSASSGTRKKHARKAAATSGQDGDAQSNQGQGKGKGKSQGQGKGKGGKSKKNEPPRVKMYIPPAKPPPIQRDPVDTLGLGSILPPDLLVVFRKLQKKDAITRRRALEDLQANWFARISIDSKDGDNDENDENGEREFVMNALDVALPAWNHHFPALILHSSKRIRYLATIIQASYMKVPAFREQLLQHVLESVESYYGAWMLSNYDPDRQVQAVAHSTWEEVVKSQISLHHGNLNEFSSSQFLRGMLSFTIQAIMRPESVYKLFYPSAPPVPSTAQPHEHTKGKDHQRKSGDTSSATPNKQQDTSVDKHRVADGEDESPSDREGRIRTSALGALKWLIESNYVSLVPDNSTKDAEDQSSYLDILANPEFWTIISPLKIPLFIENTEELGIGWEGFGYHQPGVRRAGWSLVYLLSKSHIAQIPDALPVISSAILRSIWVEPDVGVRLLARDGLLTFLSNVPEAWNFAGSEPHVEHSDSDSEDEEEIDSRPQNSAYVEFIEFLKLGCGGSCTQFYPAIVIILSKLPDLLFPRTISASQEFFSAYWAAVDGHALTVFEKGTAPYMSFVASFLECLALVITRMHSAEKEAPSAAEDQTPSVSIPNPSSSLLTSQIGLFWKSCLNNTLSVRAEEVASLLSKLLSRLQNIDQALFTLGWGEISEQTSELYQRETLEPQPTINFSAFWLSLNSHASSNIVKESVQSLLCRVSHICLERILKLQNESYAIHLQHIVFMLRNMKDNIHHDGALKQKVQKLLTDDLAHVVSSLKPAEFVNLVAGYLEYLDQIQRQEYWNKILTLLNAIEMNHRGIEVLQAMLASREIGLFDGLKAVKDESNSVMLTLMTMFQQGGNALAPIVVEGLLRNHEQFLSKRDLQTCADVLYGQIESAANGVLRENGYQPPSTLSQVARLLGLLQNILPEASQTFRDTLTAPLFVLALVYPEVAGDHRVTFYVTDLWTSVLDSDPEQTLSALRPELSSWLKDCDVQPSSEALVKAFLEIEERVTVSALEYLFPSSNFMEILFKEEISFSPDLFIAAIDLLVPETDEGDSQRPSQSTDKQGFTVYTRLSWGIVVLAIEDRQIAKHNMWILEHALLLQQIAQDQLLIPESKANGFGPEMSNEVLRNIVERVQILNAYLLSDLSSMEITHKLMVEEVKATGAVENNHYAYQFVVHLCRKGLRSDNVKLARIIRPIVGFIIRGGNMAAVDAWLSLCRGIQKKAIHTTNAIIAAISTTGMDSPLLQRMRNEVASDLTGVRSSQINEEGLRLLRLLLLLAPPPDSDSTFLPSQRAISLTQAVERWIASDEEVEPSIESSMIALFCHLAPILQSISGRHWEFAFDLIENTLENVDLEDKQSVSQLSRALNLIIVIQTLVVTNKQLKGLWEPRSISILRLVRDLLLPVQESQNAPQVLCKKLALDIMQDIPEGILEPETLSKLAHLLRDPFTRTQRLAYELLRISARNYTEKLVVEVGLDTTGEMESRLPLELLGLLEAEGLWDTTEDEAETTYNSKHFTFLLGWMTAFDAFEDTSLRVRSGYVDQMRNAQLVTRALIPSLCEFLDLGKPGRKSLKLDLYEVETFYVPLYEPSCIRLLAAHIYFRALRAIPSLIRTWFTDCKDRQLTTAISNYTALYFSPVLIASELSHLRDNSEIGGREKLEDDAFTVKISQSVSEVSVVYTVDDQPMEIAVRMPVEYPLKMVDVRDVRRVGVAEDKWRGWLFAVQQIITTQNGHIADALALFKKNVSLHFQGQVECAICYSIISVADLQLPTKPCKTCKNRFHASCLYKWFKSSSSSSCPLCRSDIF